MSWNIAGKTVVITGATRGIGRETALALAHKGAKISLLVRDRALGEKVVKELVEAGAPAADLFVADFASLKDLRRAAAELLAAHPTIDVLINNAGAIFMERAVTVDGYERTFAVNHLAYFQLTTLLLDALKRAGTARIVSVSSEAHRRARLDFDDLMCERRYAGFLAYGRSKLANILFTRELARRLEGTGVTANCLHPGVIGSNFGRNNRAFGVLMKIASPFLSSEADGAKTTVFLATSPSVEGVTGKYFKKSRECRPTRAALDDTTPARLWKASEELLARVA